MAVRPNCHEAFLCCKVRVDALTLEKAVDRFRTFTQGNTGRAIHFCNAYTLSLALGDSTYLAALNLVDMNLPDGTPLVWIGRRAGLTHLQQRVYGPDFMLAAARAGRAWGLRHYLYGSTPEVISSLERRLIELAPGIKIVGAESPPFRPLTAAEEIDFAERVQIAQPGVVWAGLGTPLQDLFVDRFRDRLSTTLVAVGAAFDFIAGTKRQAPRWMQTNGLEWAFRLATEPGRLWHRYLWGNTRFLHATWRQLLPLNQGPFT